MTRRDLLKGVCSSFGALAARGTFAATAAPAAITIAGRPVQIRIVSASAATVRITVAALDADRREPPDDRLVDRAWSAPVARFTQLTRREGVRAGQLTVGLAIERDQPIITIATRNGRRVQRLRIDRETGTLSFLLGDGPLLGLGEGGPQFDRRGSFDRMRSGQAGFELHTHGGRVPVPWLIGTGGWAMFIRHPRGTFDFIGPIEGRFEPYARAALPLDVFIVAANEPRTIMAEYARLTGYAEMPPLWSFGYQQSHRTLASREEILQEAKTFREKKLPCDAMIYLGTGFCPSGWNTDNGEFTFNPQVFPDPETIIDGLHAEHFKVVLHAVLEGRTLTGTIADPCTAPPLPSGRTENGKWPDDRVASCYWPAHKPVFDAGIDGWWPDQGDGLDEASRLARIRMYWDGCRTWRPNERPYALHRNGTAGMQRYAAFLWSGDVYSTWKTLETHVSVAVNTALSGIPFWGTDIGGFVPTKELTGELYVRWFQFGAFCPLFRSHGRTWKLRLPWGWNTGALGPNEVTNYAGGASNPDPSELHNAAVEPICRQYLELRMRLLPYLYSAVHEACTNGMPILRALWLHDPEDQKAVARGDEYLWGGDILVAPVVEKGATSRRLYLPRGTWYDFWTNDRIGGAREYDRSVDLSVMPLFVRAGAILPLAPVRQYVSEPVDAPLTMAIYPGADGRFVLYEDDGATFGYQRGDWMGLEARWTDRQRRLDLRLADGSRMRPPLERRLRVQIAGDSSVRDAIFSGKPIEVTL